MALLDQLEYIRAHGHRCWITPGKSTIQAIEGWTYRDSATGTVTSGESIVQLPPHLPTIRRWLGY